MPIDILLFILGILLLLLVMLILAVLLLPVVSQIHSLLRIKDPLSSNMLSLRNYHLMYRK